MSKIRLATLMLFFPVSLFPMNTLYRAKKKELSPRLRAVGEVMIERDVPLFEFLKKQGIALSDQEIFPDHDEESSEDECNGGQEQQLDLDEQVRGDVEVEESVREDCEDLPPSCGGPIAGCWTPFEDSQDEPEFQRQSIEECCESYQQKMWHRSLEVKKIFAENVDKPKLAILGLELSDDEIEKVGRLLYGRFFYDEIVAYKIGNKYIYAKISNVFLGKYGLTISNASRKFRKLVYVSPERVFRIYKCRVHPSMK